MKWTISCQTNDTTLQNRHRSSTYLIFWTFYAVFCQLKKPNKILLYWDSFKKFHYLSNNFILGGQHRIFYMIISVFLCGHVNCLCDHVDFRTRPFQFSCMNISISLLGHLDFFTLICRFSSYTWLCREA